MTMRKAFTLMEINLAILVMAGGILSLCGLYSFGYREVRQGSEDVLATAYADAVLSRLTAAISNPELKWETFDNLKSEYPSGKGKGWVNYCKSEDDITVDEDPEAMAESTFTEVMSDLNAPGTLSTYPTDARGEMKGGLLVQRDPGSAVVRIAFRATKKTNEFLSQPIFYTEVRFQGYNQEGGGATE